MSSGKSANNRIERVLNARGLGLVCGLDEAGRGALAGPLVVSAVILPLKIPFRVFDSKIIDKIKREGLSRQIKKLAIAWSVSLIEPRIIDEIGIQSATYQAMQNAVYSLDIRPDCLLTDFYRLPDIEIQQFSVLRGDMISQSIAAASIIAKTERDKIMQRYGSLEDYSKFGFEKNYGYGTKFHLNKIKDIKLSDLHRRQFCKKLV